MKIVVCIKQVLDTAAEISIHDGKIASPGSPLIMNPYDEFAVEEAVRIKAALPESEVTVVSLGPDSVKETLKRALAMGADRAIHILDPLFEGLSHFNVAKIHDYSYYDLIELESIVGTKNYISPEAERGYYCKASDMYSLGCILHIIYTK